MCPNHHATGPARKAAQADGFKRWIRKENTVPTLSNKDQEVLAQRGVTAHNGAFGTEITLTTLGVAWLFNYLQSSGSIGSTLTLSLLKDLANFQPINSWRALRLQAVPIPVYDTNYFQLIIYLEGSPPRAFHAFFPIISAVPKMFDVPLMEGGVFKIKNDQIVKIKFSDFEVGQLGMVCITPAQARVDA
jgi:hypothetical protein